MCCKSQWWTNNNDSMAVHTEMCEKAVHTEMCEKTPSQIKRVRKQSEKCFLENTLNASLSATYRFQR